MEIKLATFSADSPPLAVIAAAKIAGIALPSDASAAPDSAPAFLFSNGYYSFVVTFVFMAMSI